MSQAEPKKRQTRKQEDAASGRQRMGGATLKMHIEDVPKTHKARWFNHKANKLLEARRCGYQPILNGVGELGDVNTSAVENSDMGQWRKMQVGVRDGAPLYAYAMAIKKEWYDEDKAAKMGAIDESEQALRQTPLTPQGTSGESNVFVKQADIQTNVPLKR